MSITIHVPPIAFAGCPIIVRVSGAEKDQQISLKISVSGQIITSEKYTATGVEPLWIDIAEPIRGYVTLPPLVHSYPNPATPISCGCTAVVTIEGIDHALQVLPGGTSLGSVEAFLARGSIPALVASCEGALLCVEDSDLLPICLMGTAEVQLSSEARREQYTLSAGGLTAIDLRTFDPRGSLYTLSMSDRAKLYIAVTQTENPCRHTLTWRNSYGVFERVSLTGDFSITEQKEENQAGALHRFDPSRGVYDIRGERTSFRRTYTLNTGIKGREFFARTLPDIQRSDEIYLRLSYWSAPRRCTIGDTGESPLYGSQDMHSPRGTDLVLSEVRPHSYI